MNIVWETKKYLNRECNKGMNKKVIGLAIVTGFMAVPSVSILADSLNEPLLRVSQTEIKSNISDHKVTLKDKISNNVTTKSDYVASGQNGTSVWYLNTEGELHIGAGTLGNATFQNLLSDKTKDVKKIIIDGPVKTGDTVYLFWMMPNLTSIINLNQLDTSSATNMMGMFSQDSSLTELNLSSFDTSNVSGFGMANMFAGDTSLKNINLSSFDTSNVTDMSGMFQNDTALTSIDVSNFDTTNASIKQMFTGASSLTSIKLGSKFNVSSVKNDIPSAFPEPGKTPGKWQNIGGGTSTQPNGTNIWTAIDMEKNYNGATDADTYVWVPNSIVSVHDSSISADSKWNPIDNFDQDKSNVDFKDVVVTGTVDTTKAGIYKVTYTNKGTTSTATITVKEKVQVVSVHDSTINVGTEWNPVDNFDQDKSNVDFKDLTVTGAVDTTKAGTYKITYTYKGTTSTATITVKAKPQGVAKDYKKLVSIKSDNYSFYKNFSWDKNGSTKGNKGKAYYAKYVYQHVNGSSYYSIYTTDKTGAKWVGYVNVNAMKTATASDVNASFKIKAKGYKIWSSFYFTNAKSTSDKLLNKTYTAKVKYTLGNGQIYYSLYNGNKWVGYVNQKVGSINYTKVNKIVSVKGKYTRWGNLNFTMSKGSTVAKSGTTYTAEYAYKVNGSTYCSLYNAKGWQGYVNSKAVTTVQAKNVAKKVKISKNGYKVWGDLLWSKTKTTTNKIYGKTYTVKRSYALNNGQIYYSLYSGNKWIGYVNSSAVR